MEVTNNEVNEGHERHRLGKKYPKQSILRRPKHPHHRGINVARSTVRKVKGGLKEFRGE